MYPIADKKTRAAGFKHCETMDVPDALATKVQFARMKAKRAGTTARSS